MNGKKLKEIVCGISDDAEVLISIDDLGSDGYGYICLNSLCDCELTIKVSLDEEPEIITEAELLFKGCM